MAQQPRGREKYVTGEGKPIERRGEGLGTGRVGREQGYSGRGEGTPPPSGGAPQGTGGGGPTRSRSKLGIFAIIIALLFGGGFGLSNILGGGNTATPSNTNNISSPVSGLFSGFTDSSISSGWITESNSGKLNTEVSESARDKRTVYYNDSRDHATVMVYMCGTDLESKSGMASSDMKEMAAATLNSNVDVIVYTGGCKSWKINGISNTVNQIYKISNGNLSCLVKNDGTQAMTNPATLTRFINYCTKNYPANRNILVLWDHGGGSISGFGYDERNANAGSMTLKGIKDALTASNTKFDFIGFDACLMGTLENALMLEPFADYLIGSEETEPGVGWYHTRWLSELSKNPAIDTVSLGKIIVDDFVSYCNQRCPGQKTTLYVIDLPELVASVPQEFAQFANETASAINGKDYKKISDARSKTREFAVSSKSDQIDLVHLAYNIGTEKAKNLAQALLKSVKYNKTSSSVTNAYGLAIYFPYKKTSRVASAVKAYESLGLDSDYTECIRSFASLELSGQVVANDGNQASPLPSLLGNYTGSSSSTSIDIADLLSGFLGSASSSGAPVASAPSSSGGLGGLMSIAGALLGNNFNVDRAAEVINENQLVTDEWEWKEADGEKRIAISDEQWSQIHSLCLNVFYDDGEGYIDMGLDNVYKISDNGELISDFDGTWIAIDNQPVPYYYIDTFDDGTNYTITGRVPVLLNGERANLILVFDNAHPRGYIAGARTDYVNGETDTVAKGMEKLNEGDKIEFVCDFYSYEGEYLDSYRLGDELIYNGDHVISNVTVDEDNCSATYLITDIYNNEYWTPVIPD